MKVKKLIQNINILNILLLLVIMSFAFYSLYPLIDIKVKYSLPTVKKKSAEEAEVIVQNQIPSIAEYMNIPEDNLFHPERKIPEIKKEEPPLPKPDFVLYGTLITDDVSMAYLEDLKAPFSTPGRGKRQRPLKKGETMSGFTLKEIEVDKVVMLRGEERLVVSLNDPKTRESATTASTTPGTQTPKPVTQQPAKQEISKAPSTTSTSTNWPPPHARQVAPATTPSQQGTTTQQQYMMQDGPSDIKNAPYSPSLKRKSGSKGLLGIPR